ncbi:MAG TPA: hypothetical protein VMG55_20235 [Stellaceae bacterium]|nr:hypothetical protein [Stellaceae bacterium]
MARSVPVWIAAAVIAAAVAAGAMAAGMGTDNTRIDNARQRWHAADDCNRQAFKKFPDYTQEGASKRDAFVQQCLRDRHLPPPESSGQTKASGQ